ncbi:MAG: transposase, partial [Candidatus Omnitrophica bacterium]|nr:transposase [Candidatus Omnitrophota bacterium]
MPRIARVVAVGYPHHITQRGNYQQSLFENDDDRIMYLSLVKAESVKRHLRILAYCLMSNHVHFIAVPDDEDSMALTFKYAHMKYSQAINKRNGL